MAATIRKANVDLERALEERTTQLRRAIAHQTAISEVLSLIAASPTDVQPVLNAVAERAASLCNAAYARVLVIDGPILRPVAAYQDGQFFGSDVRATTSVPFDRTSLIGRAAIDRTSVHLADVVPLLATEFPGARANMLRFGLRAVLAVPLIRAAGPYGGIILARPQPGFFDADEVALVETFARQAAIAIDKVKLFNETREALDQQRASGEVLAAISSSIADTAPVFDAILAGCERLFAGTVSGVMLVEQGGLVAAAVRGPGRKELMDQGVIPLTRDLASGVAVLEGRVVDFPDVDAADFPARARENAKILAYRSIAAAPLVTAGRSIGALYVGRPVSGDFGDKNLAMLRTFADQAVIAIQNARLFEDVQSRTRDLSEALDQQRASSAVLSAISSSIADTEPVFEVILANCQRLFEGDIVGLMRLRGGMLELAAYQGPSRDRWGSLYPVPLSRDTPSGRAIIDRCVVQVPDAEADDAPVLARTAARMVGFKSVTAAPILVEGRGIGALWVARNVLGGLDDKQIALLKTFAAQAVIAIENARLFDDVQSRSRELSEALDQQRASGEVLSAISNSIADTKPVFDVILASCERLFAGHDVGLMRLRDDGMLDLGAYLGPARAALEQLFPRPLDRDSASGRAILDRQITQFPDIESPDVPEVLRRGGGSAGSKSMVFAPMLSNDRALGALWVGRTVKGEFSDKHLALLKTFARQAVIAIENARLFEDVQNRTRELSEALDQQRASGEVLAAISSSIADTKPVFDVILASCRRLFAGHTVGITLVREDGMLDVGANAGSNFQGLRQMFPHPIGRDTASGLAIVDRRLMIFTDVELPEMPVISRDGCRTMGVRSIVFAPMLFADRAIGALWVGRATTGDFGETEIAMLKTFADQAVIAIQNARLVNETREALEHQTATSEVLKAISRTTFELKPVLATLIENATRLARSDSGFVFLMEGDLFHLFASHGCPPEDDAYMRENPIPPGPGSLTGRTVLARSVVQIEDAASDPTYMRTEAQRRIGFRTMLGVPMFREGEPIGVLAFWRNDVRPFVANEVRMAASFADAAVIAIENVRLVEEIQEKSRQLEAANQHKSEFLASMSHELRTPLNAIIGFSEVLLERMFGELNEKQDDYLKDILSSGRHLLMLINDILDLAKVEAGRMELEPSSFHVPTAIDNAMTLIRERAQRHGIALGVDVDPALDEIVADERKVKQILLNLLTNAVKFTPDGGRVDVIARRVGDVLEIAVRDTGIGIAPADQEVVFEAFRQVGRHYTNKQEGTGLGLTLTRRFVELHGGRLRLESALGKGSTFTFSIPYRT